MPSRIISMVEIAPWRDSGWPMEKRTPHYDLEQLKRFLSDASTKRVTLTAYKGAVALGYMDEDSMLEVVHKLCPHHFYKSMPAEKAASLWQDVYKIKDDEKRIYIKLQLSIGGDIGVLIQFKEDESGE